MNQITPEIALRNLDNASAQIPANRETHAAIAESVKVLKEFIEANTPKKHED